MTPLTVEGDDAALAAAVDTAPDGPVRFAPSATSDFALALGLAVSPAPQGRSGPGAGGPESVVELDVLDVDGRAVVNAVVVGPAPDRLRRRHRAVETTVVVDGRTVHAGPATTVVVANGQFLHGCDAVPRGHPGDGAFEVQVYAVPAPQRTELRRRVRLGAHVPHPGIRQFRARRAEVTTSRPRPVEADGRRLPATDRLVVSLRPGALRLVVGWPA